VTVQATSVADTTKSATATITLLAATLPVTSSSAFAYSRSLTVAANQAPNTIENNFPVLVSLSDPTLRTAANGGHVTSSNGYDICFFADAGLTTPLNWEVESYNGVSGALVAWVQVPALSQQKRP
jgi:hypothetical protein